MSTERDLDRIFDSMPPPADESPADASKSSVTSDEKPAFDPYKFQHLTVSPTLRQELSSAKLPRLDPEFLEDTLPPNQVGVRPPERDAEDPVELAAPLPVRRKRTRLVLLLCLLGAAVGVVFALLMPATHETAPPQVAVPPIVERPVPAAAIHVAPSAKTDEPPVPASAPVQIAESAASRAQHEPTAPKPERRRASPSPNGATTNPSATNPPPPTPSPAGTGQGLWIEPR